MLKRIFIFWDQGFVNAPLIIKKCLISWKINNPDWNIIELNNTNLKDYIDLEKEIKNFKTKSISKASLSDIIRILILEKYGGIWCDATTLCTQSISSFIKNIKEDFFAFSFKNKNDRLISSWFLYAKPNSYIIKKWKEKTIFYINNLNNIGGPIKDTFNLWKNDKYENKHYFWFHYLFTDLYCKDVKFMNIWNNSNKVYNLHSHFFMDRLNEKFNVTDKDMLNNKNYYIFKLTYRNNKNISESILDFIYKKYDIKILNIDSNLSSYMITKFQTNNIFTTNINDNNSYKICIIRNPYERIIEYFYKIETKYSISNLNNFIMNDLNESSLIEQSKYLKYCNICLSYKNIRYNLNYLLNIFNKDHIELKINIYKLNEDDISEECKYKIKNLFPNDFKLWNSIKLKNIIFKY